MEDGARDLIIRSIDGFALNATVYDPGIRTESVVIINAATGVPRNFYKDYACHLREIGHLVVTYDYRGIGDSRPLHLKGFPARMRDWAVLDMAGVVEWSSTYYNPRFLFLIGHSIGGQAAGLITNSDKVTAMVTISAAIFHYALTS